MNRDDQVTFTDKQIDQLGHWLSECLDDAAPLNERVWRSRAEWMVKGPTFQAVMKQREADLRQRLAGEIEAQGIGADAGRNPMTGQESPDAPLHAAYNDGLDRAASIVRGGTADTDSALTGECPTPGCDGDARYAAPGRRHIEGCTYPRPADTDPAPDNTTERT